MNYLFLCLTLLIGWFSQAQSGMTVSPGKLHYYGGAGTGSSQKIKISNPTGKSLEVGVSVSDWKYDAAGSNEIVPYNSLSLSCAPWLQIMPNTFFTIEPNATKEVEVLLNVPQNTGAEPVHTAMLFFTQLNPGDSVDEDGAAIKVAVRIGVKVYHTLNKNSGVMTIENLTAHKEDNEDRVVELQYKNSGTIWTDGKINWSIFSYETGKTKQVKEEDFYTLPQDVRTARMLLPSQMAKGRYAVTAQLIFDEEKAIQLAEMDIEL